MWVRKRLNSGGRLSRLASPLIATLIGLFCIACGDTDQWDENDSSPYALETEQQVNALRGRLSKLCDCPPSTRIFYSPHFEPDCGWVCGELTEPKRCDSGATDADGDTPTIDYEWGRGSAPVSDDSCPPADAYSPRSVEAEDKEESERARLCHSVCPDGTIVGPHRCSDVAECLTTKKEHLDVSAGGSSILTTRRTTESDDEDTDARKSRRR